MAKLARFNEIVHDFSDVADFVIVYISEAHARDGWSFTVSFFFKKNCLIYRFYSRILLLV